MSAAEAELVAAEQLRIPPTRMTPGRHSQLLLSGALMVCGTQIAAAQAPGTAAPDLTAGQTVDAQQAQPTASAQLHESDDLRNARRAVELAESLFSAGNFDAALSQFDRAYALMHGDPRQFVVLHNIAVCHEHLFRYDRALDYYARYLAEGGKDAQDVMEVAATVSTLRRLLGRLRVSTNVPAEVWIDTRRVADAPGELLVPPGSHMVEVRAALWESSRKEVLIHSGRTAEITFQLEHLSQFSGVHPTYFWIGAGATAAGLLAGAWFGTNALRDHSAAQERAVQHQSVELERAVIRHETLAADVAFGAAAGFGIASMVMFALTDWERPHADHGTTSAPALVVAAQPRGLFVSWQAEVP
jgi:tetratricopeptide (TPR) repeat protein